MSDYFERVEAHLLDAVERGVRLEAQRQTLRRNSPPARERHVALPRRRSRAAARAIGAIASLGAAVALVLALTLSAGAGPPAYALVLHGDGSLTLTVNELAGIGPANARLAKLGVPIRLARLERDCHSASTPLVPANHSLAEIARPEKLGPGLGGLRMLIRPNEIPADDTLVLSFRRTLAHSKIGSIPAIYGSMGLYRDPPPRCVGRSSTDGHNHQTRQLTGATSTPHQ